MGVDLLNIVEIGNDGRARLIRRLETAGGPIYKLRDTFTVTPGARGTRAVTSPLRYGGSRAGGERVENSTITATMSVKGEGAYSAAGRVEALLETINSGSERRFVEWRPDGLAFPVYSEMRGPATWRPVYRAVEFPQTSRMSVEITIPVEPLPRGLPLDVRERFVPPADAPEPLINVLTNPTAGIDTASWIPRGQNNAAGSFVASTAFGTRSFKVTRDVDGGGADLCYFVTGRASDPLTLPCRPGQYVLARGLWRAVTIARGSSLFVAFLDIAGVILDSGSVPGSSPVGAWAETINQRGPAPAGTAYVEIRPGISLVPEGESHHVKDLVTYVTDAPLDPTTLPPDGHGDSPWFRWDGPPHASRSVQLAEPKLAEYTTASRGAGRESVTRAGMLHEGVITSAGLTVHTGREPSLDHEAIAVGQIVALAATAGQTISHFLTPGIRYRPDDGQYIFATIEGTPAAATLKIYWWNGVAAVELPGTLAANLVGSQLTDLAIAKRDALAIRCNGDLVVAEWYGATVPNTNRSNYLAQKTISLAAEAATIGTASGAMSMERVGYPVLNGYGMRDASGAYLVERFDALPFTQVAGTMPDAVQMPAVPGTAPALVDLMFTPGAGNAGFGALAWRRRIRRHNRTPLGDAGASGVYTGTGQFVTGGSFDEGGGNKDKSAFLQDGATGTSAGVVTRVAAGGPNPDLPSFYRIATAALAGGLNGAAYRIFDRVRKGRLYTLELYAALSTGTPGFEILVIGNDVTQLLAAPYRGKANDGGFAFADGVHRIQFRALADAEMVDVVFRNMGAVARTLDVTGIRLWEGAAADAPCDWSQSAGRGAQPPFGVLRAMNAVPPAGSWTTSLFDPWQRGYSLAVPGDGGGYGLSWLIDPNLLELPDFAGDDLDVEVYGFAAIDSAINSPRAQLFATAADAFAGTAVIYPREDAPATFRNLVKPSVGSGVDRMWKLGTLTFSREQRQVGRHLLTFNIAHSGPGTSTVVFRGLLCLPVATRASSPSGKVDDSYYPDFAASSLSRWKIIRSDGSGQHLDRSGDVGVRVTGIAGEPIELPPGDGELLIAPYPGVPDDPTLDSTSRALLTTFGANNAPFLHAAVTPRYRLLSPTRR